MWCFHYGCVTLISIGTLGGLHLILVIRLAKFRLMVQIMALVASSISRWLGCKAEYYLLSCSTHSISCLQLSRITKRSLAWGKFLHGPNGCDAFITYVCYWVWFCPWEMFAGEFFWCGSLQLNIPNITANYWKSIPLCVCVCVDFMKLHNVLWLHVYVC